MGGKMPTRVEKCGPSSYRIFPSPGFLKYFKQRFESTALFISIKKFNFYLKSELQNKFLRIIYCVAFGRYTLQVYGMWYTGIYFLWNTAIIPTLKNGYKEERLSTVERPDMSILWRGWTKNKVLKIPAKWFLSKEFVFRGGKAGKTGTKKKRQRNLNFFN